MPDRDDAARTQPLPVLTAPRERRPLLGRLTAASWAAAAALAAAQYTTPADHAPRLVRGAAWSAGCLCLFAGVAGLSAMAAAAVAVHCARAAETRRRILHGGIDGELAAQHTHLRSLAAQAAALNGQAGGEQRGRVLRLADTEGHSGRRDRHGA